MNLVMTLMNVWKILVQKAIHVCICQEVLCEKLQMVKLSKEMEILVVKVIKCMMVIVVSAHL